MKELIQALYADRLAATRDRRTCRPRRCCWCSRWSATSRVNFAGEQRCCRPPAAELAAPGAAAGGYRVHAGLVRGCCCGSQAARAHAADEHRRVRLPGGARRRCLIASQLARAALRRGCDLAECRSPVLASLLLAWLIAANSHIVKAALEWSGLGERGAGDPADARRLAAAVRRCFPSRQGLKSPRCTSTSSASAALSWAASPRWRAPRASTVTGSDRNVYPPMSTQLEALGITLTEGFEAAQLAPAPDVVWSAT